MHFPAIFPLITRSSEEQLQAPPPDSPSQAQTSAVGVPPDSPTTASRDAALIHRQISQHGGGTLGAGEHEVPRNEPFQTPPPAPDPAMQMVFGTDLAFVDVGFIGLRDTGELRVTTMILHTELQPRS